MGSLEAAAAAMAAENDGAIFVGMSERGV